MTQDASTRQQAAEITRRNVRTVRELEQLAVADPSFADRTASFVARFCGSVWFVMACGRRWSRSSSPPSS